MPESPGGMPSATTDGIKKKIPNIITSEGTGQMLGHFIMMFDLIDIQTTDVSVAIPPEYGPTGSNALSGT